MTALIPAIQKDGNPVVFKPELEKDTILERYRVGQAKDLVVLHNKPPQWNEDTRSYVLNFSGRVTVASVKNFQIIHENDRKSLFLKINKEINLFSGLYCDAVWKS
jgi:tubby-related protein 1